MALAYRTEAKRSSALAVVVAFLAVLLGVSQLAPRGEGAAASTDSDAATALLHRDVARMRAAAAPVAHKTLTGTPLVMAETTRFLDDIDAPSLTRRARARLVDHAAAAVVGVCVRCFEMLQAVRPMLVVDAADERGFWARKTFRLGP